MFKNIPKQVLFFVVVVLIILIFVIPILINWAFQTKAPIQFLSAEWEVGDFLQFYGMIITTILTISVTLFGIWKVFLQTEKNHKKNIKTVQKNHKKEMKILKCNFQDDIRKRVLPYFALDRLIDTEAIKSPLSAMFKDTNDWMTGKNAPPICKSPSANTKRAFRKALKIHVIQETLPTDMNVNDTENTNFNISREKLFELPKDIYYSINNGVVSAQYKLPKNIYKLVKHSGWRELEIGHEHNPKFRYWCFRLTNIGVGSAVNLKIWFGRKDEDKAPEVHLNMFPNEEMRLGIYIEEIADADIGDYKLFLAYSNIYEDRYVQEWSMKIEDVQNTKITIGEGRQRVAKETNEEKL